LSSSRVGQVTFRISTRVSLKKCFIFCHMSCSA
jgi:hypothetical protein